MPTVLTIAGFDPSSGAGITADLAVFAAHGLFGISAITALTVQSTLGVRSIQAVGEDLLQETLAALENDLPPHGIKIGMLGSMGCVIAVTTFVEGLHRLGRRPIIVLDPVLRSTSGRALLEDAGISLLRERLLPLVDWATPNLNELRALLGLSGHRTVSFERSEVLSQAHDLQDCYPGLGLVVTGGEQHPPDDLVLPPRGERGATVEFWLLGKRVETSATHGTGCAFSSALLSRLVLRDEPADAARAAKHYVAEALRRAVPRGHGRGPMNLLWPLSHISTTQS